ncbi:MAG: cell wall hydrolase [Blautia sp.]|nr:cell wall hydrolase [Blautia sp.]
MKKNRIRSMLFLILSMIFVLTVGCMTVSAETKTGFVTENGKTYYINKDGSRQKGWLSLNGKKYYFNKKTGVQLKGWAKDSSGKVIRYFTKGSGCMVTGYLTDSKVHIRYFEPDTGLLTRGWRTDKNGKKQYFTSGSGVMAQGWMENSKGEKRYFEKKTGYMLTGWQTLSQKKYYFKSSGIMVCNQTLTIEGKTWKFDKNGVATAVKKEEEVQEAKVYDSHNNRYYTMKKEYFTHPGIADGSISDLELLAAVCDAEAGDQGLVGMEAAALTVLNRSIDKTKCFPSELRYIIYQTGQFAVVSDGALLRRLKGKFEEPVLARKAAQAAVKIFNAYKTNGTKRVLKGFKTKDFDYKYFMTEPAFKAQKLDFDKLTYEKYIDHVFFTEWISG